MLEFLTPLGWLVACAALVPVGAAVLRARRDDRVRALLDLRPPGLGAVVATSLAAVLAIALLAAAAARPAVRTGSAERVRTDAQVYLVLDVSRSMQARRPRGATRFERERRAAERIAAALGDIRVGVVSLTDRPLPHVFPTADSAVVASVLERALGIQRPPPEAGTNLAGRATAFAPLVQLGLAGYFTARAKHRLAILLTDGESTLYSPEAVARQLAAAHVGLLVVRFWHPDERVYTNGRIERYRPDPGSLRPLEHLTATSAGLYDEGALPRAMKAAREWLGRGRTATIGRPGRLELAPYTALAALLPVAFLIWRRNP
jgi:hypothetical protein